jgi:membrane protease YdiL (CAAX protease family)
MNNRSTMILIRALLFTALAAVFLVLAGQVRWMRSTAPALGGVMLSLVIYILLACREELAFRGYPLRRLKSAYGLWTAQAIVAIVFALEHVAGGATWAQAFTGPAIGSLLFGMAAIATDGLAVPIGLHAAWNFGDWIQGGKDSTGVWQQIPAGNAHVAAMISFATVSLGGTLGFWLWYRLRSSSDAGHRDLR